jgi:arabinogalactan oligomer/maltooligosaccharide transport system permease protein
MTRRSAILESAILHAVALVGTAFAVYPILWVVSLAFSARGLSVDPQIVPLPTETIAGLVRGYQSGEWEEFWRSLGNFRAVFTAGDGMFLRQFLNSLVVSGATALSSVLIATPAAYALARMPFVGKEASVRVLLATQMFPTVASAVPLYILLDRLALLDTHAGLVLVYASSAVPFAIFQLRGAFQSIPIDLEEAAMVDGATRSQAFVRVVLPAARPAIAITFLFAFMSAWNEFILAATLLSKEASFTLPVVLQRYVGEHDAAWGLFAAGAIVVSLPVMALFYLAQRQLLAGLTAGGVKG